MRNVKIAEKKLKRVAAKVGDSPVRLSVLCRYLNEEFKSLSVRFRSEAGTYFSVHGYFSPDHMNDPDDKRYNVVMIYDRADPKLVPARYIWDSILGVLVHEFRHGYQEQKRGFAASPSFKNTNTNLAYLSDYDEIDAYAFEAAYAIKNKMPHTWIKRKYKAIAISSPKVYNKFLKKLYLFTHK